MSTATLGRPVMAIDQQYPTLSPLTDVVARRDWRAVLDLIHACEPRLQFLAARMVGERIDDASVAEVEALASEKGVLAVMVAGAALIELGWKARTGYGAKHVSREQFAAFRLYLRRAERHLIEVTAYEPGNATAWTLRLLTARGLGLGQNEARRRYAHATTALPHFYSAQVQLLQQLCPKWSGSWDEMHAFARESAFAAPPGSVNGALVVDGHMERWLDKRVGDGAVAYLRQPAVRDEVSRAAGQSVLHPSFRPGTPGWVWAHNAFAMYWSLVGDRRAAGVHFRAVGDYVHEFPWTYYADPVATFQRMRRKALAKG